LLLLEEESNMDVYEKVLQSSGSANGPRKMNYEGKKLGKYNAPVMKRVGMYNMQTKKRLGIYS
jgi:hypothetical protein